MIHSGSTVAEARERRFVICTIFYCVWSNIFMLLVDTLGHPKSCYPNVTLYSVSNHFVFVHNASLNSGNENLPLPITFPKMEACKVKKHLLENKISPVPSDSIMKSKSLHFIFTYLVCWGADVKIWNMFNSRCFTILRIRDLCWVRPLSWFYPV